MTSPSKIIPLTILTDRTSEETDELCGMKYWWYKLEGGKGIVPVTAEDFFTEGRNLHHDLEDFSIGTSTEDVIHHLLTQPLPDDQVGRELYYRRLGWAAAWGEYYEPLMKKEFDEVSCEAETILDRDPLWVAVTPDRIQRRRGGKLVYREWKSTRSMQPAWQEHWQYAIQLHLGMMAVKEELGEGFDYGQVTGFYKGTDRGGRLIHPYVWAYFKDGQWSHAYKAGWDHRPVWEYEGGILDWVRRCGREVAESQLIFSAPVILDERKVEEWVAVRKARHTEIQAAKERAKTDLVYRREVFKPISIHCRPPYGPPCAYLAACHNYAVQSDPVGSKLYAVREPHHDLEKLAQKEAERG